MRHRWSGWGNNPPCAHSQGGPPDYRDRAHADSFLEPGLVKGVIDLLGLIRLPGGILGFCLWLRFQYYFGHDLNCLLGSIIDQSLACRYSINSLRLHLLYLALATLCSRRSDRRCTPVWRAHTTVPDFCMHRHALPVLVARLPFRRCRRSPRRSGVIAQQSRRGSYSRGERLLWRLFPKFSCQEFHVQPKLRRHQSWQLRIFRWWPTIRLGQENVWQSLKRNPKK